MKVTINGKHFTTDWNKPGVFLLVCEPEKRAFFGEGAVIYFAVTSIVSELEAGTFLNKALLADYKKYGADEFLFQPVKADTDLDTEAKRLECLKDLKARWEGPLY